MASQSTPQPGRQDAVRVDPKHYTVELENERMRVVRIRYGPKEKSVMHGHPASLAIMLTKSRVRFNFPDGSSEEIDVTPGQVIYHEALDHLPENLGNQPLEALLVEFKG